MIFKPLPLHGNVCYNQHPSRTSTSAVALLAATITAAVSIVSSAGQATPLPGRGQVSKTTDVEWGTAKTIDATDKYYDWCENWQDDNVDDDVDVAIIGAGPAGLAAAIGLLSSAASSGDSSPPSSLIVKIYERAPSLRSSSQGMLSLWPNGMSYLFRIRSDLPGKIIEAGCPFESATFVKIDGDGNMTSQTNARDPGTVLIRWHALQTVLASLLPYNVLITGHSLVTYKEFDESNSSEGGVRLLFDNGKIVRAKIVIGADGTFSSVRRVMHRNDRPIYFGQMNWNAILPTSDLPPNARPTPNGVKAISYEGLDTADRWTAFINDCGGDHTFLQLCVTDPDKALSMSGSKGRGGLGLVGVKEALLPIARASKDLTRVLQVTPEEIIFERAICGRLPASSWRSPGGRVALLGDAATGMHPSSGQGANSALGAAAHLAESVIASFKECSVVEHEEKNGIRISDRLVQGLEQYEASCRPKMDLVHRVANLFGCAQASGKQYFQNKATSLAWTKWTRTPNDTPPPSNGLEVVKSFDPLSCPGVSML